MGRRPELKSNEFLVVTAMYVEIISILVEIARRSSHRNGTTYWDFESLPPVHYAHLCQVQLIPHLNSKSFYSLLLLILSLLQKYVLVVVTHEKDAAVA